MKNLLLEIGTAAMLLSSSAAAAPLDWPCQAAGCRETCVYQGKGSLSSSVKLMTIFERERGPAGHDIMTARTQAWVSGGFMAWNLEFLIDERDTFSAPMDRLGLVELNVRKIANEEIRRQTWDRFIFREGQGSQLGEASLRHTEAYRIESGNDPRQFESRYGVFGEFFPLATFGEEWMPVYDSGRPDRRSDLDSSKIQDDASSPLTLGFLRSRFLEPGIEHDFQLFTGKPSDANAEALRLVPRDLVSRDGKGLVRWAEQLVVGDLSSPVGDPTILVVDPASHLLREIDLRLAYKNYGTFGAVVRLQGCHLDQADY